MNVIAEVAPDGATALLSTSDDRGRLAARLLEHADNPREVEKVTSRKGAPGHYYRVPVALARAAGFLHDPETEPGPDGELPRTEPETETGGTPTVTVQVPADAPAASPSTAPDRPAPGTPAPELVAEQADEPDIPAEPDPAPAEPTPAPAKKAPAKKAAPRTTTPKKQESPDVEQ